MAKTPREKRFLTPHFDDVRAHYDLSDDFFQLFLDPTLTYSCAYFERDDMTLEEAQLAKIDLALSELGLEPGMTLLEATRIQSLQPHYAKTLDMWAEALQAHRAEAVAIQSEKVYDRYMKYLTGCADMFRVGYIDVNQLTLEKR